jgi:hypothetical protein
MAFVIFGTEAYISFVDSRKKTSVHAINVSTADAKAYVAAADEAARAATEVGVYFDAVMALSNGAASDRGIRYNTKDNALVIPPVDDEIFGFDKLTVGWSSGLENFSLTIPARKMDAIEVVARNGDIDMATGAAQDWIQAFLDVATTRSGNPATQVTYMRVTQ